MKWSAIGLLFLMAGGGLKAQTFGGFPPYFKFRQIDSDTARVIYTEGASKQAAEIFSIISRIASDTVRSLGPVRRKVNILLQSQTTEANGYVALAPFRSEFFLIPGTDIQRFGNLSWQENLAIHEYRHVHQYNNFRRGVSAAFYYLFGEGGQALANALSVPDWFFEGDAVHSETALTGGGRGRLPYFLSGHRSLWASGKDYSWMKLRNGSLKDYVPDHYQLGYLLVNYGYQKYGSGFWGKVTRDASAFKGLFYPLQSAIKRHTGISYKQFRREALEFYKKDIVPDSTLHKGTVTNHYLPQDIGNGAILFLKEGYNKIPAFHIKGIEEERKIMTRAISSEEWFSYADGKIAYTSFSTHPRWTLVNYSDIRIVDSETKKERKITSGQKYFTPDISPDGNRVVAVRVSDSLETELNILDIVNGNVQSVIKHSSDYYLLHPRFISDNEIVVITRRGAQEAALQIYNIQTQKWRELLPFSTHTLSYPFFSEGKIYFVSNRSGNDEIYSLDLKQNFISQHTRGGTGNYFPSARGGRILYSHFTSNGLQIDSTQINPVVINPMTWMEYEPGEYAVALEKPLGVVPVERHSEKRYRKSKGLFNFHSWIPNYIDPEFSFSILSNNILNTFSSEIYYRYNQNETSHTTGANIVYGGWFPQVYAGASFTFDRTIRTSSRTFELNQFEGRTGFRIPLNFTQGRSYKILSGGSEIVTNRRSFTGIYKDSFKLDPVNYLNHSISWAHYSQRARQHIYPRLGYTIVNSFRHSLSSSAYLGIASAQVFLPSFGNHSIVLQGSIQQTDTSFSVFSNRFAFSRGYTDFLFARSWKLGANYHFPILYPDFGIAQILYFQRIRGNGFYDYTRVYSNDKTASKNLRSVGGEIFFDTKWWNQLPITLGIRVSHLLDNGFSSADRKGSNYFEVILPVSLY